MRGHVRDLIHASPGIQDEGALAAHHMIARDHSSKEAGLSIIGLTRKSTEKIKGEANLRVAPSLLALMIIDYFDYIN